MLCIYSVYIYTCIFCRCLRTGFRTGSGPGRYMITSHIVHALYTELKGEVNSEIKVYTIKQVIFELAYYFQFNKYEYLLLLNLS